MAGAYFVFKDVVKDSVPSFAHVGTGSSTVVATLPQANLLDRRVAKVCRVNYSGYNTTSEMRHTFTLASSGTVAAVAFVGWNALGLTRPPFQFRVRDSIASPTIDTGWVTESWDAAASQAMTVLFLAGGNNTIASTLICSVRPHTAAGVPGTGTLDIGRVFAGSAIILPNGVKEDWQVTVADSSRVLRSRGQNLYAENLPRYRVGNYRAQAVDQYVAHNDPVSFLAMGYEAGVSGEVLVVPRTSYYGYVQQLGIYGRLAKAPTIQHVGGGYYDVDATVEEGL